MKLLGFCLIQLGVIVMFGLAPVIYFWDSIFPNAGKGFEIYISLISLVTIVGSIIGGIVTVSLSD